MRRWSPPALSTRTLSGLSEKMFGPGPTGSALDLTAQERPEKKRLVAVSVAGTYISYSVGSVATPVVAS